MLGKIDGTAEIVCPRCKETNVFIEDKAFITPKWSARIADKGEPLRVTITPSELQNETKPITVESLNAAIEALKKASEPPPFECLWLIYNTDEQRERYEAYFGDKVKYIKSPGCYTEKPVLYLKP
jgi:phage FluMu protein Com